MPSVGPYCRACASRSEAIVCIVRAKEPGGKCSCPAVRPASEMTSGRSVTAMRSRIAEDFMTWVREANRPA